MQKSLENETIIITGGGSGLGKAMADLLILTGAKVIVLSRKPVNFFAENVINICGDVTDKEFIFKTVEEFKPTILILNAGATPVMAPLDEQTWDTFSTVWNNDVKAGLYGIQAALKIPLSKGTRVLVTSSGAALVGAPLSGSYAGAKRMLWFMAQHANEISAQKKLDIRFQIIAPMQMIGETKLAQTVAGAYAQRSGISVEEHIEKRYGKPMSAHEYAKRVITLLKDTSYDGDVNQQSGIFLIKN
jgi:NAD(P)-dependent dehydrogenase (short-subunit alcohol dehydrogenase family)